MFQSIRDDCVASGRLYEDPDFRAANSSLYYDKEPDRLITWMRPSVRCGNSLTWTPVTAISHYNDVIMGAIASLITSLTIFTQPFIQTQVKENIKAPRQCFHVMTSSCINPLRLVDTYIHQWAGSPLVEVMAGRSCCPHVLPESIIAVREDVLCIIAATMSEAQWSAIAEVWATPLHWRHNGRDGGSHHQPHDCLLKCLFRRRSNKTSNIRVTGLCAGNSPVTGEFPAQMTSNAENVSIWWRHHVRALGSDWF